MTKKESKKTKHLTHKGKKFLFTKWPQITAGLLGSLVLIFALYNSLFIGKIYPGVSIANYSVGGKTPEEAALFLSKKISQPKKVVLSKDQEIFEISLSQLDFSYDFKKTADKAYNLDRSDHPLESIYLKILTVSRKANLDLDVNLNQERLRENLSLFINPMATQPVYPQVSLVSGRLVVEKGSPGEEVDQEKLTQAIEDSLRRQKTSPIPIIFKELDPSLSEEEALVLEERAKNLLEKKLLLNHGLQTFSYQENDLLTLLKPKLDYYQDDIYLLVSEVAVEIDHGPQNPIFVFEGGLVKEFAPAKDGVKVVNKALFEKILQSLKILEKTDEDIVNIDIEVLRTPPDYQTEDVNDLGIKELLGRGNSTFWGSISSRIYNISLASSKFNGILVAPGDLFSFNQTLGDVSALTGYKQAYVISEGKTILGDGGGVCQVSTTLFRAILDAGFPIIERRAHSYRVGYYEQNYPPGIDATVYSPTTDLKFRNDTPNHILIQTIFDRKTARLSFEIYGSSDGRVSTISKPVVGSSVPPPEDLYTDDPTLPTGEIKQIDWKAWGAKVYFNYKVEKDGEILHQKTFYSNYQPWQAKFLRGTGPVNQ